MTTNNWQFWIDRGGKFTDVIACSPDRNVETIKLLMENPEQYNNAAIAAIRQATGIASGRLPPFDLRIGTKVATNALLEHNGEPTCLAITRGFGDALNIGYQEWLKLFVRQISLPQPLHSHVIEINERVAAVGKVLEPLDEEGARAKLQIAFDGGLRSLAIVLMHSFHFSSWRHTEFALNKMERYF